MTLPHKNKSLVILAGFALLKLAIHLATGATYGLHRDEYLYIAQAAHLDWGFISVPPFTAASAWLSQHLFGDSVAGFRLFPALAGSLTLILTGLMVMELGGGSWAVILSSMAFLLSGFLRANGMLQPVPFDILFWAAACWLFLRMMNRNDPRYWLPLGAVLGLAFLNKYMIAFLAPGLLVALVLSDRRGLLRSKQLLIALGIGLAIAAPNILWQYHHRWPVVGHMAELRETQLSHMTAAAFLFDQATMFFPSIPIWVGGFIALLFFKAERANRWIAVLYLAVLAVFLLARGKSYYSMGIYPLVLAAGGCAAEKYWTGKKTWIKYTAVGFMALSFTPMLPYTLPVLEYSAMERYAAGAANAGFTGALRWEDGKIHRLPQDYADMAGWRELSGIVLKTYRDLPDTLRVNCLIRALNYGEAGAIRFHTGKYGLPEPVCYSESFCLWAPDSINPSCAIYVIADGVDLPALNTFFGKVDETGRVTDRYAREQGTRVLLCTQPRDTFKLYYKTAIKELKAQYGE